jgi:hypothetical protein
MKSIFPHPRACSRADGLEQRDVGVDLVTFHIAGTTLIYWWQIDGNIEIAVQSSNVPFIPDIDAKYERNFIFITEN